MGQFFISLNIPSLILSIYIFNFGNANLVHNLIKYQNNKLVVEAVQSLNPLPNGWLAFTTFAPWNNKTGWSYLKIVTNDQIEDNEQAYLAGYAEGFVTHELIYAHWHNTRKDFCENRQQLCKNINDFFLQNNKWLKHMMQKHLKNDPWWYQVSLYFRQLEGMYAGYQKAAKPEQKLTWQDIFMINMNWDLETLTSALDPEQAQKEVFIPGSCSAIIKVLADRSDLLVAHNTWTRYSDMLRIMKFYNFTFHTSPMSNTVIPGRMMSFTSYPGAIISGDDYYVIGSGIVAMETTNDIKNRSLYSFISPIGQVMTAIRSMVANRLSNDAKEWISSFSKMNSGTYNNQWIVTDFKKFKPGYPLKQGTVWIAEQMPGLIISEDVSNVINKNGYWGSYNIPYIKKIYEISGLRKEEQKFGDWYSYSECPRAKMFKRDQSSIHTMENLMTLMRSNNYLMDPLSQCRNCTPIENACNAIAARCDLNPPNGSYPIPNLRHRMHGAIDAKVSNSSFIRNLLMYAVSGPTPGNNLPVFQWDEMRAEDQIPHKGHPNVWNFNPNVFDWEKFVTLSL